VVVRVALLLVLRPRPGVARLRAVREAEPVVHLGDALVLRPLGEDAGRAARAVVHHAPGVRAELLELLRLDELQRALELRVAEHAVLDVLDGRVRVRNDVAERRGLHAAGLAVRVEHVPRGHRRFREARVSAQALLHCVGQRRCRRVSVGAVHRHDDPEDVRRVIRRARPVRVEEPRRRLGRPELLRHRREDRALALGLRIGRLAGRGPGQAEDELEGMVREGGKRGDQLSPRYILVRI